MSDPRVVEDLRKVVNTKDSYKNTPLHYATQLWPQEVVIYLNDHTVLNAIRESLF